MNPETLESFLLTHGDGLEYPVSSQACALWWGQSLHSKSQLGGRTGEKKNAAWRKGFSLMVCKLLDQLLVCLADKNPVDNSSVTCIGPTSLPMIENDDGRGPYSFSRDEPSVSG